MAGEVGLDGQAAVLSTMEKEWKIVLDHVTYQFHLNEVIHVSEYPLSIRNV